MQEETIKELKNDNEQKTGIIEELKTIIEQNKITQDEEKYNKLMQDNKQLEEALMQINTKVEGIQINFNKEKESWFTK